MNDATWPTFIAAPFIWPSTSKICSAASACRRSEAARRPVGGAGDVGRPRRVVARRLAAGEPAELRRPPQPAGRIEPSSLRAIPSDSTEEVP